MNARIGGLVVLLLAMGVVVVGCGGDDDGSSDGDGSTVAAVKTSQLSKAAYVKKVNSECANLRKNLVSEASAFLSKQSGGGKPEPLGSTKEQVTNAKLGQEVIVPTVEKEMAAIRKQGAPTGDEKDIEAILAADQEGIDEVKGLKKTESLQDILDEFAVATKALDKYGLKACGN